MFVPDERLASLIFDYCRWRLALDPVALGLPGRQGRPRQGPRRASSGRGRKIPAAVLELFAEQLAPAVISCDSPRFLAFIPAAPTKASLLFDMVVSCSSLQGTSWLEAAGAVAAENQALAPARPTWPACPPPPAGASCRAVAPATCRPWSWRARRAAAGSAAAARRGCGWRSATRPTRRSARPCDVIGMDALVVPHRRPPPDRRRRWRRPWRPIPTRPAWSPWWPPPARPTPGSSTTWPASPTWPRPASCGSTSTAPTAARPCSRRRSGTASPGIEQADSFVVDPHKWLFAPFDCAALIYRHPQLARAVHTQDASYLDVLHTDAPTSGTRATTPTT